MLYRVLYGYFNLELPEAIVNNDTELNIKISYVIRCCIVFCMESLIWNFLKLLLTNDTELNY